eukprot:6519074-Prymnesium_polylepis.1
MRGHNPRHVLHEGVELPCRSRQEAQALGWRGGRTVPDGAHEPLHPSHCVAKHLRGRRRAGPGVAHAVDRVLHLLVDRERGGGGRD